METFVALIIPLKQYSVLTSIFFSFFGGEPAVLALAFLSVQQFIHPLTLGIVAFTTAICAESFWFLLGRSSFAKSITERMTRSSRAIDFYKKIDRIENGHWFKILFIAHIFSGTTIVYILRLSRKISYTRFIIYCALVNIIWTPTVILIGWSAGKGFSILLTIFEGIHTVISISFVLLISGYIVYRLFTKYIITNLRP